MKRVSCVFPVVAALFSCAPNEAQGDPATTVQRYAGAAQAKDYATLLDLTLTYQASVERIKAGNPKALWKSQIGEYRERELAALTAARPNVWRQLLMGESMGRVALTLFPPEAAWNVSETRVRDVQRIGAPTPERITTVYVTTSYPDLAVSPAIEDKFLQKTIVEFTVDASGLIRSLGRVSRADEYWTKPYPASAAPFLASLYVERLAAANKWTAAPIIEELEALDWAAVELALLGYLGAARPEEMSRNDWYLVERVSHMLAAHRSPGATRLLVGLLRHDDAYCDLAFLDGLAAIGKAGSEEEIEALTVGLGRAILLGFTDRVDPECVVAYLAALRVVDDDRWLGFPVEYTGERPRADCTHDHDHDDGFSAVLDGLCEEGAGSRWIDAESPNVSEVRVWARTLAGCERYSCPADFLVQDVAVVGPQTLRLKGRQREVDMSERSFYRAVTKDRSFDLTLRATQDTAHPWVVREVQLGPWEAVQPPE